MTTMAVEEQLNRVLRRRLFQTKVISFATIQQFIPYHVDKLSRGDQTTRANFRYIQKWYTRAFNLSLEQVRTYMDLIDTRELQGFSVEPITREYENEEGMSDYDYGDEKEGEEKGSKEACDDYNADDSDDDTPAPLTPDEDISTNMGIKSQEDFESYLANNLPSHSPPGVEVPSNTQETQCHQGDAATPATYDQDGFYIGDYDREERCEEPEDALLTGTELHRRASDLEASSRMSQQSSSTEYELEDRPLSNELRDLLEKIGADANIARTDRVVTLTTDEFDVLELGWTHRVNETKKDEASKKWLRRLYGESVEETDLLDTFDENSGMFYWQTEGLFLCRLTELVHKESFEAVRDVWRTEVELTNYKKGKRPRPSSPLRNEICM
ncbi:hypothetical protein F4782DRAFT_509788 [Xylaria castorea]|nr:hypothetical protein F4782DRAFT_509788 [Xylaria castorea]